MKKLIIIAIMSTMLAGCFDYVQPRDTHVTVTEAHQESTQAAESVSLNEIDKMMPVETETATQAETETETERETVIVYVTQGVNIRAQQTKLSDRLGGAGFGESFEAYADTLEDEFVEIVYGEGTAFAYGRCLTTDYDVISEMRAEYAQRQTETQPQTEKLAINENELAITETESGLLQETEITTVSDIIIDDFAENPQKETEYVTETELLTEKETETYSAAVYTPDYFKQAGVIYWGGSKWTWYTQRILPGEGLWIPGRHLDENGYVCDENGYICCAADLSYIPRYTVIETPFGKLGKIYDTGCAYGVVDIYTDWLP